MKKFITSLFLVFAVAGGVLAGMPLHAEKPGMSKCCDKAKEKGHAPEMKAANLCCLLNCSDTAPTSSSSFNMSPSAVVVRDNISAQIADLFEYRTAALKVPSFIERVVVPKKLHPKYLQYHSFLI